MIGVPLALLLLVPAYDKPAAKLPLGKETTYITEPLDKDGYLDYEAAINDRLGKGITPEKNANVLLWKAFGPKADGSAAIPDEFFKRLGIDPLPEKGEYFLDLRSYLRDRARLDRDELAAIDDQQAQAMKRPWAAKDYPHLAEWLKANDKPLALVVEATGRPDYFQPLISRKSDKDRSLIGGMFRGVQKCRESGSALLMRAMLRLGEGRPADAWRDLLACHRLGRLVARGSSLVDALIGIAFDSMASNADLVYLDRPGLTAKQAQACLRDLQRLPPMPPLADRIDLGERFIFLDLVQSVHRRGFKALEFFGSGKSDPNAEKLFAAIDWEPALRNGNRWYDRMAAALRLKDRARREEEFGRLEEELRKLKENVGSPFQMADTIKELLGGKERGKELDRRVGDVLIGSLVPNLRPTRNGVDRLEQTQRNLHLAFSLAAYRADRGRYPEKLDDLAPKYLPAVPDDLFSAKALIYHPEEKGYLLYSVGVNGKDEGGRWTDDDPPGDDIRVRMPLPELKRQK